MRLKTISLATTFLLSMTAGLPTSGGAETEGCVVSFSQPPQAEDCGANNAAVQEYFPRDFHVHIAAISDAKEQVQWFVTYLKQFVHGSGFADGAFELYANFIEENLVEITRSVTGLAPDMEAAQMLGYAQHMFEVMVDSLVLLRKYNSGRSHTNKVVSNVFSLTASLLALRDAHGVPDFRRPNYTALLSNFRHDFHIVETGVRELRELKVPLKGIVEQQLVSAKHDIEELEKYIANQ
ncbi:hypothetical protein JCM33374_g5912 [Metschnikowia sp. JCM 33374]|nr:hypothetical protein JCM33374_g5912 [Metschnikowia sp. JCM 33374]